MVRTFDCAWKKFDSTQHRYAIPAHHATLPATVNLASLCPPVYDQGSLGSCTAHGWGGLVEYLKAKQGVKDWMPSRLFIYWCERSIEGSTSSDSGSSVADGAKALISKGVCLETLWPYDVTKFTVCPPTPAFGDAVQNRLPAAQHIDNTRGNEIKSAIASGFPVVFGCDIYASFESNSVTKTGQVPYPKSAEELLGGHCMLIVGYDDLHAFPATYGLPRGAFIVRNSWGADWGVGGYCYMPYKYLTSARLAGDFWTSSKIG